MAISTYCRSVTPHSMLISVNFRNDPYGGDIYTSTIISSCRIAGPLQTFLQEFTRVHGDDLTGLRDISGAGSHLRLYSVTGVSYGFLLADHYAVATHLTYETYGMHVHDVYQSITGTAWSAIFEMRLLAQGMR